MVRILRYIVFLLIFSDIILPAGFAAVDSDDLHSEPGSQILFCILDLRFYEADSLLDESRAADPENPGTIYLRDYLEFLDVLISGDRNSFEHYLEASGQRIDVLRSGEPSYFELSSIHLNSSVLCAYHNEMFRSVKHFYSAHRYLKQAEEVDTGSVRILRNMGLITMAIGSVSDEYNWLLKVLGMKGELDEGMGYLEDYYRAAGGSDRIEACLLLMYTGNMVDKGAVNRELAGECKPDSMTLYRYARALGDLKNGRSREVVENLTDFKQGEDERILPFLDLLLGEALLNGLDTGANVLFEQFLGSYSGEHYRHFGWHKLSWCYAIKGDWDLYRQAREQVLKSGRPYPDADRQALREAQDTLPLNTGLLKLRLLFDGGYYQEALAVMEEGYALVLQNRRDSVEYIYRRARTYDRLGEHDRAVFDYERVVDAVAGEDWYYAPNAALHLGMIYEAEGDSDKALDYYRECLKINKSAYEKSISLKARQGIRRLGD